jgi:O-antigen ligase
MNIKIINLTWKKSIPHVVIFCLSTIISGIVILRTTELPYKYIFGLVFVFPLAFAFIGDLHKFMLGLFLLLLPVSLNIAPFNTIFASNNPQHQGGAQPYFELWVSDIPFFILLIIWLLDISLKKKRVKFTPLDIPAVLFIMWSGLSIIISTRFDLSIFQLLTMVKIYLVFFFFHNNFRTLNSIKFAIGILIIGLFIQSIIGIGQYWLNIPFSMGEGGMMYRGGILQSPELGKVFRVQGTVGWPTTFGLYLAMLLVLCLVFIITERKHTPKFYISAFCMGLFTLLITFARAALVSFLFVAILALCFLRKRSLIKFPMIKLITALTLFVFFIGITIGKPLYRRITAINTEATTDRILLIKVSLEMIKEHPLLGIGINTFAEVMANYDKTGVSKKMLLPVHNFALLVASETGLVGLLLLFWFGVSSIKMGLSCLRSKGRILIIITLGLLAAIIVAYIQNMTIGGDFTLYSPVLITSVLLGLLGACWKISRSIIKGPNIIDC